MICRGWEAGVKALDRERGARSAALTPAGPRLRCCYLGNVIWDLELHAHTKPLTDLVGVDRLLLGAM
jgi:hypothetical protein